jgi:tRNA pseudouridine55 synthase
VAIGRATRTVSSPAWDAKLYWADVRFGTATDTNDADGQIVATGPVDQITPELISAALPRFVGDISQRPPAYSAVHVGGRRAYQLARQAREGQEASSTLLPERPVHVDGISFVRWASPVASLLIQCGSGTYIRSIARDLGEALACPAHLSALVRLRVGPFEIIDAVDLQTIEMLAQRDVWHRVLWPVDITASGANAIIARASRVIDFGHGRSWTTGELGLRAQPDDASIADSAVRSPPSIVAGVRVYADDGAFLGFARRADRSTWQPVLAIPISSSEAAPV